MPVLPGKSEAEATEWLVVCCQTLMPGVQFRPATYPLEWPGASLFISLCLSVLSCKTGTLAPASQGWQEEHLDTSIQEASDGF